MVSLMVGRELTDLYPEKVRVSAHVPLLSVRDLHVPGWAHGISFDVHPGEILGFAGLVGSGRTEMFEGLLGLRPAQYSKLEFKGRPLTIRTPQDAVAAGITYLSEDRKGKGLHLDFGLRQNLTLMALDRYSSPLLDHVAEQTALQRDVQTYGIQSRSMKVNAGALSGGNQQKLALAKILQPDPHVVILDEPTRGVDVGAKRDIYILIQQLARSGRAVIVISSELMELIGLCHRITVIRGGQQQATVDADGATEEALISHATGTH
jgi:ribose transport system ATP-binding protein